MKSTLAVAALFSLLVLTGTPRAESQPTMPLPQPSPEASLSQTIGISEVRVSYHRPGIKGRKVWGDLVPYSIVWRAGANENTTLSFSTPVTVGGKTLPAGTYALHMIPTAGDWTIIFNKNATSWGSFFYKESEDALRFTVKPQPSENHEWLQYEFSDLSDSTGTLSLQWEKLRVPIPLAFETRRIVIDNARDVYLRGLAGFSWQGFNQAAQYSLRNGTNLNEALNWINQSIGIAETYPNLRTKAAILEKMGNTAEVASLRSKAMMIATEADINALGYTYLQANNLKEAIATFEKNIKDHPNSWNVYDSLGEALDRNGDVKGAIANYEKALKMAGDDVNKKRISETLTKLKAK
jgi:tetratricopeptide (TPR) repeat protein